MDPAIDIMAVLHANPRWVSGCIFYRSNIKQCEGPRRVVAGRLETRGLLLSTAWRCIWSINRELQLHIERYLYGSNWLPLLELGGGGYKIIVIEGNATIIA